MKIYTEMKTTWTKGSGKETNLSKLEKITTA